MAELYENPKQYVTAGGAVGDSANGVPTVERMLAELPPEEREEAMKYITAPPTGEEIMKAMKEKNANGEVMNMTLDQYRLFKAHNKTKETDVIAAIGEAGSVVVDEISKAAGSIVDDPTGAVKKLTPSLIEAFAQGTRNLYGMAAQSADPNSIFFKMKNALQANGDDEVAEFRQFMEAQAFNVQSMRLMTGQDTILMDKDLINPEMTQVMSYVADPTLFIPFGGIAAKGATMIGMGEKLALAASRAHAIRNMVLGGAIKWGAGAPLEFMGGAIRNTIDYGIETGSRVIETASGIPAKEIQTTARLSGWGTAAASVAGFEVNSTLGQASKLYAGSGIASNVGQALTMYGEQMMKQGKTGRGVLGYAGQAIRDTEKAGVKLTPQVKSLLKAIEAVDPLFVYADDIAMGAAQGAIIGGGLGYLAGGEEGMAGGIGSGIALGAIGAGAGKVVSDVTGNTKLDQMRIQRKLVIEGLREQGNDNHIAFDAMAKMAEATGDREFIGYIDGIIAGVDTVNPDAVFKAFNTKEYNDHLTRLGIDPETGVLKEKSRIFPELNDRTVKADVLGILRDTGNRFAGDAEGFEKAINNAPEFAKLKPIWSRLDDNAKQVILKQIKNNADPEFVKGLRGRQLNAHWSDLAYSERLAEMINTLHQKNANSVPDKIRETLKAETRSDKKLTRRGQMLKEKLQADGYIDKDGNIRPSRLADVEETSGEFKASAGWTKRRDSTGRTEVVINLEKWAKDSGNRLSLAHEVYHSMMLESVFGPDYTDRLSQKLIGKVDPKTGRIIEPAIIQPNELMKFFGKYIENDPNNRGDQETIKRKKEELLKSIEEYRTRGTANRVVDSTVRPLEHLVEEFGAYYFSKWLRGQSVDFLFRGGEFGGIRGVIEMAKDGWLDYWKGKVGEKNPQFNFDAMGERGISKAFERDGKRIASRSLDLFMRDIVRIEANRNKTTGFDLSSLSNESREWFIKVNGLRGAGFGQVDKQGKVKKPSLRKYTAEEIRQGKEMFKVLESLPDAAHKDGMRRDGNGNWSGKPNTAQINALVGAGYIQRAWFDRLMRAYDIVEGNGSNVIEFGYLGYSAHIGDGDERVYGAAVPFKNRKAVLIGVDFKVRADGTVFANLHTLDLKVIEARGNEIWKDPQTRELWKGNRTDMEADFYAYLSNASLPSGHPNRKQSALLLDKGDGLGGQRRDALHQMLGFHKNSDLPYINRPIAEIPVGIRHSVTTFSNDGIVNMRVDNKQRYDFNFENAHLDLSRNFMPDEMTQETTPSGGKIIKHATGYQISKQAGTKFKVFDPEGKHLGDFDTIADAGRAAQKHFNAAHEAKTEGKDPAVPRTEVPPSRHAFIEREFEKTAATYNNTFVGGKDNYVNNVKVLLDRLINGKEDVGVGDGYIERAKKLRESIEKDGSIKLRDLEELSKLGAGIMHDTSRLPYYNYDFFWQITGDLLTEHSKKAGERYDNMYPMEIKSALHGQLAQIFQDHPNITAQGLLKKLVKYGSRGNRFFQEATEIGLVDLLKSKIQRTTSLMRADASEAVRGSPELAGFLGNIISVPRGGETQPRLNVQEILDFAKSKEIRVTIEEGAREVNGMDTSNFTLGGTKSNYKQTAVRINPEYAHGIRGHYGEDTIVHFRTTERIDADGNVHLFIEEVQANNTDVKQGVDAKKLEKDKQLLPKLEQILAEGRRTGVYIEQQGAGGTVTTSAIRALFSRAETLNATDGIKTILLNNKDLISRTVGDVPLFEYIATSQFLSVLQTYYDVINQYSMEARRQPEGSVLREAAEARLNNAILDVEETVLKHFRQGANLTDKEKIQGRKYAVAFSEIPEFRAMFDELGQLTKKKFQFDAFADKLVGQTDSGYGMNPHFLFAEIDDIKTRIKQSQAVEKPLPLTALKDWSLTALKGIIRQAIRDGRDTITLTHPDDSPTVSHMAGDARRSLYGKLIPELWGSWLRKYGIEIKQTNKLKDPSIEQAKARLAEVSSKISEAQKKAMTIFEQVGQTEDSSVIMKLDRILNMPVHQYDGNLRTHLDLVKQVRDVQLQDALVEVLQLKQTELDNYNKVLELQELSVPERHGVHAKQGSGNEALDARISAEALDRGMTFVLNDRVKQDFLDGKISTHHMPAEGNETVPPARGSTKLKVGFSRVYHQTTADNIESIRKNGLLVSKSRPSSESRGVSVSETPFYGDNPELVTIELQVPTDKLRQANGSALLEDVPAGNIIAIHEPWHDRARYIESNKQSLNEVLNGDMDFMLGDGSPEAKAIEYIKNKYNKKSSRHMPAEGEQGGRVYTEKDTGILNSRIDNLLSKIGIKLQDKTKVEIWKRKLIDDPETHLEVINSEGLQAWMRQTAEQFLDFDADAEGDIDAGQLKYQQKQAQKVLDALSKNQERRNFMPAEGEQGGRVYTDEQMASEFIGRVASENPKLTKGLVLSFNPSSDGSESWLHLSKKDGSRIGNMDIAISGTEAEIVYSQVGNQYQFKGYGTLMYSETVERLRSMGIKTVTGMIIDDKGRPLKIRRRVIDKENERVGGQRTSKDAIRRDSEGSTQIDVTSYLEQKAWYMPAEGEQGGRTYKDFQLGGRFIGKYAQENPNITKGLEIEYYSNDTSDFKDVDGTKWRVSLRDKAGNDIGDIAFEYEQRGGFFNGTEDVDGLVVSDISVNIRPEHRGKNYQHLLYSEMFERARATGAIGFSQNIENKGGLPLKSVNKIVGKDGSKIWTLRDYEPVSTTQENFDRLMSNAPKMRSGKGFHSEFVQNNGKLDPNAHYMPAEPMPPTRDQGFNRVYREISRNKRLAAQSIKQEYLERWGIDLNDYEEHANLTDALYKLEQAQRDGRDNHDFLENSQELKEMISDLEKRMDYQITETQGDYALQFTDQQEEIRSGLRSIESIIDTISRKPLDEVDRLSGTNRLDAILKKELGSGFAQEIADGDVWIADAFRNYAGMKYEREMIGAAFESELYSSSSDYDKADGERFGKKGILVDILRAENKLTKDGKPQGEVNPQRIINALRNKSGGDSKVYAEAKAIGLIDWLESKQGGKNQHKVTTKELIDFVENNKMGLEIDPQLEQAADFGDTKPYVTGGEEQAKKGYRVYVVRMTNPKHKHGVEGHFGGAVVHVRVTLRNSKDGKKVMHIEEIQANNSNTGILSNAEKKVIEEELKVWARLEKEEDALQLRDDSEKRTISMTQMSLEESRQANSDRQNRNRIAQDKLYTKYAAELYDANPEYWHEKFNTPKTGRDGYLRLVKDFIEMQNTSVIVSEKKTSLNKVANNAPLQDPKEWVKVAFRTVLRKALVEGVDRITVTPWNKTPLQVGMKAKPAEAFYGKTIVDAFNSELRKMNSRLGATNVSENIPRQRYEASRISTNEGLQRVASAVVPSELNGTKAKELFELLHKDDADLKSNHNYHALNTRFDYLINTIPDGTSGKWEIMQAAKRRLNQYGDYLTMLEAKDKDAKTPSGRSVVESASNMSESEYLVDTSMGFDLTPEMKKKAARPQRMFQPAEYTEFKSEQSPLGRIMRNAKGYVITMTGNKFRVYNPAKAILGIYNSEEEAKKRIYREIPKQ